MKRKIGILTTLILIIVCVQTAKASEINYSLLYNWQYQPPNVQMDLVRKNTNIQVVDQLDWESPDLYETYAYTRMYPISGTTITPYIDIRIKKGYEFSLTHEVGHALSDYGMYMYWWCEQPIFDYIWQAERYNCILLFQGISDKREYFACAYDAYIRYPEMLKNMCPLTYNYITVVLNYT